MAEELDLTVSIVTYNRCDLLRSCLASVVSNTIGIGFEVIVVDNASTDGSADMVAQEFPHVRLIGNRKNLGFAKPNNQAFAESRGKYFLLLNSDTIVQPGALEAMVQFMDAKSDAGVVGPRLLNPDGTNQASVFSRFPSVLTSVVINSLAFIVLDRLFPLWNYPGRFVAAVEMSDQPQEVRHVIGACMMIRSHLYREMGMLDEQFFIFREETDLCKKIRDAGWKIYYLPAAKVIHYGAGGPAAWHPTQPSRIGLAVESEWLYHSKHYGAPAANWLVLANLCAVSGSLLCLFLLSVILFWHSGKRRFLQDLAASRHAILRAYLQLVVRKPGRRSPAGEYQHC
jgi:hypothetical protein